MGGWNRVGIAAAALLAMAAFPACYWWQRNAPASLKVYGNIELTQVDVAFKISGKLIALPVEEGTAVTRGTILGRLDTLQLENQRNRDQAALATAESQIPQLLTTIARQKATLVADTDVRRAQLAQAEARLRDLLSGARTQEIQQARAVADEARSQHEQARQDWERAQILFKNDDISRAQFDQYRTRFEATAAALKGAEEKLALISEGPRKEEIEGARAQVAQARAAIQLSEASGLEIVRLQQELLTRQSQVEQARAQVGIVQAQIADAVAVAPVNGVVLVKSAESGEVLAAGTTFLTIGELDRPWLRAYVGEQDLGRVKLGDKVRVITDSYPGKVYWGRISFIASEAEFTPKQIQTPEERVKLVYRIKIDVENPRHELKLNMPAEAEIVLDRLKMP
jgi:HlyD family secretion protein